MPPLSLLHLPNEVLIVILDNLHPFRCESLDWRTATVHNNSTSTGDVGIYSVRASCKRLRDLATPFAFGQLRLWTANGATVCSDPVTTDPQIFNAVRTLHLDSRAHTTENAARNRLPNIILRFTSVAELLIQDFTAVSEQLLNTIAQLRTLKHLWISSLTEEAAFLDIPALKDLSLESLSVCGVTIFADPAYAFRNTKHVYRPLIALLSGSTSKSLRFLHIRRAPETLMHRLNFSLASPLQRLEDIIPVDVRFPSLEVLKLDGVDSARYWLGRRSEDFPNLHTFMFGNDPIPKVSSPTSIGWHRLRCLHIGRLHSDEHIVANSSTLTELSISSPMDQENLEELEAALCASKNLKPIASLRSLSISLLLRPGVVSMPVSLEHMSDFFDCLQDLEKLSIVSSSEICMELWNFHQDNLLRAFSKLKQLQSLRTNLIPTPIKQCPSAEQFDVDQDDQEALAGFSQKIAKVCPKLESLFCISKKRNICQKVRICGRDIESAEVFVKLEGKMSCVGKDCVFYASPDVRIPSIPTASILN